MTLAATIAQETVQLKHHYDFNRDNVYQAWSNPEVLGKWFGPASHNCKVEQFDFKEGGDYQLRLIPLDREQEDTDCAGETGQDSVCAGKFVQIIPGEKIVMTFTWTENGGDIGETLLTIELFDADSGTDVLLTHERLPDEAMRDAHAEGWSSTLECLEEYLQH